MLNITNIRIAKVEAGEKLRGFASITIDNCFVISDLRILEGDEGYFVAMPSKRKRDGSFKDIAHPINNEVRKQIEEQILTAYENATGRIAIPTSEKTDCNYNTQSKFLNIEEFGFIAKK